VNFPQTALLLDAGLGSRLAQVSHGIAKPLLPVAGTPLIDHALDRLATAGVRRVVVSAQYHLDQLERHLAARRGGPETVLRPVADAKDGRGAAIDALTAGLLGPDPFTIVNGDSFWLDGPAPALQRLAAGFDPARLDVALLVHRTFQVIADVGLGEFLIDNLGHPRRRNEREVAPYVFAGVQIISPALLEASPEAPDFDALWDQAIAAERLEAVVHDGLWYRLSNPADLAEAQASLRDRALGETR